MIIKKKNNDITKLGNESEGEDELISGELFKQWKGLIKPDSCIFKSWLADNKRKRYSKDDNYQEYIGGIFATANKDSIEFFYKKNNRREE
ncbi:hypothetical protein DRF65_15035 [Chryseobacterium pennae]|uniref:Uncharacterized protein n=1 Tax=Chryseobacterium pennae TaxID=2258962 RepID=A0A3D9C6K7_9FLAO|nr:hypothetical protein [Chryseobacterium pennae]REC61505.1 hypothetical protein DRF65_15035 [Chryseobacterium pennae]